MFTVKIMVKHDHPGINGGSSYTTWSTKLIEASEVSIHSHQPGELAEISGVRSDGQYFYRYIVNLDKPRPEGFHEDVELNAYAAYIENSSGATTEVVKF